MARRLIVLALLFIAAQATASGWKKSYFAATPAGSWARYSDVAPEMKMTTTLSRLADEGGAARITAEMKFENNQYPSVLNEYTLPAGYAIDRELIDFMAHAVAGRSASGGGEPQELDPATVEIMAKASPAYGSSATFKGTETVGGRKCDRYGYTIERHVGPPTREVGDLWLSDAVPFGLVQQTSTTKDAKGKVVSTYKRTLIASGKGESAAATKTATPAAQAAKASTSTLKAAFDAGLIRIKARVIPGSKNGERVHLVIAAKDDQPLRLTVPKGKTSLHVDIPLGDFNFDVAAEKSFDLTGGKVAELDVTQTGEKRALEGEFEISVYEGTPLWSGSATVGYVKK